MTEPDSPNGRNISTTYTYNSLNQLTNVAMCSYVPGSPCSGTTQTRTFAYTGMDMTSATNPENGTVTYTYDTAHHVLSKTDAIGQITTYDWDIYGRLTAQKFYPLYSGTPTLDPNQTVLYYYDTNPYQPTFSNNAQGRLTAVLMNTYMWYEYTYTPSGRVQDQRFSVGGNFYDSAYTWDHEGRMSSLQWPAVSGTTGPLYQYQFDAMGRMNAMVDSSSGSPVATATYTVANQLLGLTYFGMTENRDYNSLLQLTGQTVSGMFLGSVINLRYYYPYGTNNGLILSSSDSHLGETVKHTYDSLNHLSSAAVSGGWSQAYTYDGFGNLTSKSAAGSYPAYSASFDGSNHQVGMGYDANGNQTSSGTYDVSNRLVTNTSGESYAYDYRGKRIVKWLSGGGAELYVYGIDGKKLTTMVLCYSNLTYCGGGQYNLYFKGKLIEAAGHIVVTDRAGSVRWSGMGGTATYSSYYPYGEERTPTTADDREKFGTYTRDNPGQDYADQRYYGVGTGRFLSADAGGGNASSAATLNKYSYVAGDPINNVDPRGRDLMLIGGAGMGKTCNVDGIDTDCSMVCNPTGGLGDAFTLLGDSSDDVCEDDTNTGPVSSGPASAPTPPTITLQQVDDCVQPHGTGITPGSWTLFVEYQVLVNGKPVYGNSALDDLGIVITESVTPTGPGNITIVGGPGWCPVGGNCGKNAGTMSSSGMFWDMLSGQGTTNQQFLFNGSAIQVTFAGGTGSQTTLQNTYDSARHVISVGKGALTGNNHTRDCGKNGDPGIN